MSQASFKTTRRIEFADTDMVGIVHFANFFRFMEAAEVEFLRSRGLSVSMRFGSELVGLPRVSASCDFFRPVFFQDLVEISVRVQRIGQKSVSYDFEFAKDGEPVAKGQITACCCRIVPDKPMQSIDIPEEIRKILERPE
jgi:YbgC/YbaW family acyl-CoA thioester hydrolase